MSQAGTINATDGMPSIPTLFVADSGSAIPAANTLNILGGPGITTSGSGNTLIITATGTGFAWNIVTSADNPVTLVKENGYIAKGAGVVNFILPAAASVGDTFWIKGYGNLWTLAQNAFQNVSLGYVTSMTGVGGSVSAYQVKDGIEIICVTANTEFEIIDAIGNPKIV